MVSHSKNFILANVQYLVETQAGKVLASEKAKVLCVMEENYYLKVLQNETHCSLNN